MDRRTAAMVAAELMMYPMHKLIAEEGIIEAAHKVRVRWPDASVRRYGAYDAVLAAISVLDADRRYQRAVACTRAIERALARLDAFDRWVCTRYFFEGCSLQEIGMRRRTFFAAKERIIRVTYEELRAAGIKPYDGEEDAA